MSKRRITATLTTVTAALLFHSGPAAAEMENFSFSGFGTLGAVVTDISDLQFVRIGSEAQGSNRLNMGSDSVLGVQGNFGFGNNSEAVVQILAQHTPKDDYTPRAALAFISFAPSSELTLRGGRLRVPAFTLSDSRNVNDRRGNTLGVSIDVVF